MQILAHQMITSQRYCVIGGGFYGAIVAIYLKRLSRHNRVDIYEKETSIMMRSSYRNQARVHGGYHYPRHLLTGLRCQKNLERFVSDWKDCIEDASDEYYVISRQYSKITSRQFQSYCRLIGAKLENADARIWKLLNSSIVEDIFKVNEFSFDSKKLASRIEAELEAHRISCFCDQEVLRVEKGQRLSLRVVSRDSQDISDEHEYDAVLNCTYSGLSKFRDNSKVEAIPLRHEIAELSLIKLPEPLRNVSITVMDGPFFSIRPFPSQKCSSISHVRYTPRLQWIDSREIDPYVILSRSNLSSNSGLMIRDASRYIPSLKKTIYLDSLYEIKTTLLKNTVDSGRPILFEKSDQLPGLYSILGGKIDNIYDALEAIHDISGPVT